MTIQVLFLCPHGAGKSILAATYFRAAAARIGLEANASAAGPEPDETVKPSVRKLLTSQGFNVTTAPPHFATTNEVLAADVVVNIGCDPGLLNTDRQMIEWDLPQLGDDFDGVVQDLHRRAEILAFDLNDEHKRAGS
jgi:arsenate reductase (thioredoxin)